MARHQISAALHGKSWRFGLGALMATVLFSILGFTVAPSAFSQSPDTPPLPAPLPDTFTEPPAPVDGIVPQPPEIKDSEPTGDAIDSFLDVQLHSLLIHLQVATGNLEVCGSPCSLDRDLSNTLDGLSSLCAKAAPDDFRQNPAYDPATHGKMLDSYESMCDMVQAGRSEIGPSGDGHAWQDVAQDMIARLESDISN